MDSFAPVDVDPHGVLSGMPVDTWECRRHPALALWVALIFGSVLMLVPPVSFAAGPPTIVLTSSRVAVLNDGRDSAEIIAEVRDSSGRYVPDGTLVTFNTNLGFFAEGGPMTRATTRAGSARVRLRGQQKGTATVTATVAGGGFQKVDIVFTDDPADTFEGNAYIVVQATGSIVYAAAERILEANSARSVDGGAGIDGAHVAYRNIEIRAERVQLDCTVNTVRAAGNVSLKRGRRDLQCARLHYNLMSGKGYAVVEAGARLTPVSIEGQELTTTPVEGGIAPKFFEMVDLSTARLLIQARQVTLLPGDRLLLQRPRFYEDGSHLFTLAYYSLPLYASQLFSEQFLSVGTQGVGLDLPLYYDLSPVSRGVARVKYGERYGSAYARRPGFAVDVIQAYNSSGTTRRYSGEFGFTGLTRGDWGFRWTHSQEFGPDTLTGLHLDFPQHRSAFGSLNLNQRLGPLRLGLNASANTTLQSPSFSGTHADVYIETTPARLARTPAYWSIGTSATTRRTRSSYSRTYHLSESVQARVFTPSLRLDSATTISNAVSVGHVWTRTGVSGSSMYASTNLSRSLGGSRTLQLGYDFVDQPGQSVEGQHRVSLSTGSYDERWGYYLYNTYLLDTGSLSLVGDVSYGLARSWRVGVSASIQRYREGSYSDFIFTLARSLGGRDLVLSYSTFNHRIMLDLQAARF